MTNTISVADAKATFSDLVRRAEGGEEILVTRNGETVAKLGPVRPREGGFLRQEVVIHDEHWWQPDEALADEFGIGGS